MKAKRQLSSQAQVAKICRQYIKGLGLEVTARSDSFSMGDSVDVTVQNATGEQRAAIEAELNQYQYGHFDGMNDIYESSNCRDDIPQTKYLSISFRYDDDFEQKAYEWLKEHYMPTDEAAELPELYKDADPNTRVFNDWLSSAVYRVLTGSPTRWREDADILPLKGEYINFWRDFKPATTAPVLKAAPSISGADVHEIFHTKKEVNIYIVTLPSMERDEFNTMRDHVKSLGGWYSRKFGASPAGFAFNTREEAEAFAGGQAAEVTPEIKCAECNHVWTDAHGEMSTCPNCDGVQYAKVKAVNTAQGERMAEKLEAIAEKAQAEADSKLADRQTNTAKRLAQAMSARIDGQRLERAATAARELAKLWKAGAIADSLKKYNSKKSLVDALGAELEPVANGFHAYYMQTGKPATGADAALWAIAAGEVNQEEETRIKIENEVQFANIEGFFPTPKAVAAQMLESLSPELLAKDMIYALEPSAGSGALCDAIKKQWPNNSIVAMEENYKLVQLLEHKGYEVFHTDFLTHEPTPCLDLVMMNPPFERMQDIAHIMQAFKWLHEGGELVAIASAGVQWRGDKKSAAFREWLEERSGTIEALPENSFKESGTSVNTVLIKVSK